MVSVRETIESEQYQQWKREIFFFYFKAKSRIIRNNKNFFFFFFSMVCLTLNIFILSTVFVHSILYHVILKCSFLSRLTKLCVVRNVLLCIKMLRVFFWFISVWSSSLVFLTIYLFIFIKIIPLSLSFFLPLLWVHPVKYTLSIVNSYFFVVLFILTLLFLFLFNPNVYCTFVEIETYITPCA